MKKRQIPRYKLLVRIDALGTAWVHLFPEPSLGRKMFKTVGEAVAQLAAYTVSKLSSVQGTTTKVKARADLVDRIEAIGRTGRVIAATTPGLEEKFVLPVMPSDQVVSMTARVFARDAEPLQDRFIAHDMPKTFHADLEEAIGRFEQAILAREAGKDERVAARSRIETALSSGLEAVRALDAIVANRLGDDPAMMAVWKRERKVSYPGRAAVSVDEPVPETVAPAAAGVASAQEPAASPAAASQA